MSHSLAEHIIIRLEVDIHQPPDFAQDGSASIPILSVVEGSVLAPLTSELHLKPESLPTVLKNKAVGADVATVEALGAMDVRVPIVRALNLNCKVLEARKTAIWHDIQAIDQRRDGREARKNRSAPAASRMPVDLEFDAGIDGWEEV